MLLLQVIGTDKLPDYKEKGNFPFTIATIHETLRINTVGKLLKMEFVKMFVHGSRKPFIEPFYSYCTKISSKMKFLVNFCCSFGEFTTYR